MMPTIEGNTRVNGVLVKRLLLFLGNHFQNYEFKVGEMPRTSEFFNSRTNESQSRSVTVCSRVVVNYFNQYMYKLHSY